MPDIENNEELAPIDPIDPIDPIETDDLIETDEPDEKVNEDEIVTLAEVSIPDFPTPFYHTSNPDGTRAAVKLSELKDYLNSMK